MDPATTASSTPAVNNAPAFYVGMELESAGHARELVNAYAMRHKFAVKNGLVYNKEKSLLLLCKRAKLPNTRKLPPTIGAIDDNDSLTASERVPAYALQLSVDGAVQKQLTDTWIITQLVDHHEGHQLQGIDPRAYPDNRPLTAEARATMLDLVRHSNASYTSIASVIYTTYGQSLLGRDVYNIRLYSNARHGLLQNSSDLCGARATYIA
ncbi:hypothetical protein V1527DRAFT_62952 [Lipomyces starkeyi]